MLCDVTARRITWRTLYDTQCPHNVLMRRVLSVQPIVVVRTRYQ